MLEFIAADSTSAILAVLDRFGHDAVVMAGGTHLMRRIANGDVSPRAVVSIERAADLCALDMGSLPRLGALVTLRSLAAAADLGGVSGLRAAAALCGGWQTQNVATIGGNICQAAPTADLVPPLLVHGATVILESAGATRRRMPLERFILGPHRTARAENELLVAIELDAVPARTADVFEKVGRRSAMEVAIVSLAVRITLAEDGTTLEDVRIAVGAVADVPFRAREAEALLRGHGLSDARIADAAQAMVRAAAPVDDARAGAAYRGAVLPRIFGRALRDCVRAAARRPDEQEET